MSTMKTQEHILELIDSEKGQMEIIPNEGQILLNWSKARSTKIPSKKTQELQPKKDTNGPCLHFEKEEIVGFSFKIDIDNLCAKLGVLLKKEEYSGQLDVINNKTLLISKLKELTKGLLTSREIQCLSLSLIGLSAKQAGKVLYISYRTVEAHLQKALHDLQFYTKLECLESMMERNLLFIWHDLGKMLVNEYSNNKRRNPG